VERQLSLVSIRFGPFTLATTPHQRTSQGKHLWPHTAGVLVFQAHLPKEASKICCKKMHSTWSTSSDSFQCESRRPFELDKAFRLTLVHERDLAPLLDYLGRPAPGRPHHFGTLNTRGRPVSAEPDESPDKGEALPRACGRFLRMAALNRVRSTPSAHCKGIGLPRSHLKFARHGQTGTTENKGGRVCTSVCTFRFFEPQSPTNPYR
jgi:hypothetical protein